MRDRLVTLGGALVALLLVIALFGPGGPDPLESVPRPLSDERRGAGLAALAEWLGEQGIPTASLRERYDRLVDWPGDGHLLISSLPHLNAARHLELEVLHGWIAAGNTLLVLAALQDTQLWSLASGGGELPLDLEGLTGLRFEWMVEDEPEEADAEPDESDGRFPSSSGGRQAVIEPHRRHPLLEGVTRLEARSPLPAGVFELHAPEGVLVLELATDAETGGGALWARRSGAGHILVSGYAGLFDNATIGRADNRELAANLLALALRPGGRVIFDDMHQGATVLYDPEAFFSDPRLHGTLAFLLVLWLLWVVGASDRFAPPPAEPALAERDFIAAAGGFLARVSGPAATARRLYEHFFNELRRHSGKVENGEPYWQPLRSSRSLDPALGRRLEEQYRRLARGRGDPREVHNLILEVRRNLQ